MWRLLVLVAAVLLMAGCQKEENHRQSNWLYELIVLGSNATNIALYKNRAVPESVMGDPVFLHSLLKLSED